MSLMRPITNRQLHKNSLALRMKGGLAGYLFVLPVFLFFALFVLYPLVGACRMSLFKETFRTSEFIGLRNYLRLFGDEVFWYSLRNTLFFAAVVVPAAACFGLVTSAVIVHMKERQQSFYRGVFYLPAVSSVVTIAIIWKWMYHPIYGMINALIGIFGAESVNWLGSPTYALPALMLVVFLFNVGQPVILYTAAMGGIPPVYYEVATLEGASPWQKFLYVTLQFVKPTTLYIIVILTIASFQTFAVVQLMTGGGPAYSTTTIVYQLYKAAFTFGDFGKASAYGVILALIVAGISVIQYRWMTSDIEF